MKILRYPIIYIFCFLLGNLYLSAQAYVPFPDSNAVWRVDFITHNSTNSYQYILSNDTIFGQDNYTKVFKINNYSTNYIGAIRQNIPQKKVYFLPSGKSSDTLLYDFSLSVGDTLPPVYNLVNPTIIKSIDSILIGSKYRRKLNIDPDGCISNIISLIEGIGSTVGLLEELCVFEATGNLVCFIENGKTLYPDSNTICDTITTITDQQLKDNLIRIFPNPNNGIFRVSLPFFRNEQPSIIIYNVIGSIVYKQEHVKTGKSSINLGYQPSGIYYLHINTATNILIKKVIIINE